MLKLLEPEMVPIQFWRRRSDPLTSKGWGEVRKRELTRTGGVCEYCGSPGKIIHHEYEFHISDNTLLDKHVISRFVSGFAVSCYRCNLVLHWQFSSGTGRGNTALQHLMKIRNINETDAWKIVTEKVNVWVKRCQMIPKYGDADRYIFRSDGMYVDTYTGAVFR